MNKKTTATIVPHSHWDRAWYVTFQEFRIRLVRLIDRLIMTLEDNPDYTFFMLDGQTSILEDYLEVRPDRAELLQEMARAGRFSIGPWYVLPDEFLVSPEALIRNLMVGHQMGEPYGGVMKVGYVPDGFGHIGQLPQIFRGFDIDSAFFWRGVGAEADEIGIEFDWYAKDGSQVLGIWMPWGYHNLSNVGYPIRWGDTSQMAFDWELALTQIEDALQKQDPFSNTTARLLMNGIDHAEAEPRLPELVKLANKAFTDADFKIGTLSEHLEHVRAQQQTLPSFTGEFRWGRYSEILQGVYSTRIYLKQRNHDIETLLERYTEPLTSYAAFAGASLPDSTQQLLWTAWHWLLKNHPHDDIYGSGIDQVHREMLFRFDQAEQIGQVLVRDSLRQLVREINFTGQPGMPILVYNPLSWSRNEAAIGDIAFDFDDPAADQFVLKDACGNDIPYQILDDSEKIWLETLKPNHKRVIQVAVSVSVPACGYTTLYASAGQSQGASSGSLWEFNETGVENEFLKLTIESDGGLALLDKQTGHTYSDLGHFHDVDDAGDEYSYCPCANSETFSTQNGQALIQCVTTGPVLVRFKVSQTLTIPERLTDDRQSRSSAQVPLNIVSWITVYRDQPGVYIRAEVDNTAEDHKLTVEFPTDLAPAQAHVDASFQVSARDITLPPSEGWLEDPTPLMHQRTFTDLSQNNRGFAILNRGLPSVEVYRTEQGTSIAPTLLRGVGWLSRDDLNNRRISAGPIVPTPEAQCKGRQVFEYAIMPHTGSWEAVIATAHKYNAPLLLARANTHEGMELREMPFIGVDLDWYNEVAKPIAWPRAGSLPDTMSFITLAPDDLVLSAVRSSENEGNLIVRFYNPGDKPLTATLTSYRPLQAIYRLNLNEERRATITLLENSTNASDEGWMSDRYTVHIPISSGQIITCELQAMQQV